MHLKTKPWAHQTEAFNFALEKRGAMLAMDMGVGKSRVAIELIAQRKHRLVLIVCPKSVIDVWPAEFRKHSATPVVLLPLSNGSVAARAKELKQRVALSTSPNLPVVAIVNYDAAWREPLATVIAKTPWDIVIADETHRIKQPSGKASWFLTRLGKLVPYRLGLTGTPMPHSPLDIYAQYRFLDPSLYGTSFARFRNRYALMGGYGNHQVLGFQNETDFRQRFFSIAFQVKSEDVLDLPPVLHLVRSTALGSEAAKVYSDLRKQFVADVQDDTVTTNNALTRLLRLQQVTSGFVRTDEGQLVQLDDAKENLLADVFEDLAPEEPVVVFNRFLHDIDICRQICSKQHRGVLELSGRVNELADWQAGKAPILAVQIQSGGVGINLSRAHYAVYYSLGFSLGDYLQSQARLHRPGQKFPTRYIHLVVSRSVDEHVYAALEKREDVIKTILQEAKKERQEELVRA